MNKANLVKSALKSRKSSPKAVPVKVVNTVETDEVSDKPRKFPPSLHLTTDDLAAIKGWKVGQTYKITLEVEMNGIRQGSMYEMVDGPEDKKTSADFKVKSVRTS